MKYVNAPHNEHHAIEDQARAIRARYLEVREELKANNEGRKRQELQEYYQRQAVG